VAGGGQDDLRRSSVITHVTKKTAKTSLKGGSAIQPQPLPSQTRPRMNEGTSQSALRSPVQQVTTFFFPFSRQPNFHDHARWTGHGCCPMFDDVFKTRLSPFPGWLSGGTIHFLLIILNKLDLVCLDQLFRPFTNHTTSPSTMKFTPVLFAGLAAVSQVQVRPNSWYTY
jgi:hypothetical protein